MNTLSPGTSVSLEQTTRQNRLQELESANKHDAIIIIASLLTYKGVYKANCS